MRTPHAIHYTRHLAFADGPAFEQSGAYAIDTQGQPHCQTEFICLIQPALSRNDIAKFLRHVRLYGQVWVQS